MTREEAIQALKWFKEYKQLKEEDYRIQDENSDWYYLVTEHDFEAFELAIKALEQEPIDYKAQYERFSKNAEIVISQLREDRDRLLEVLDKIRAEIEQDAFKDVSGSKFIFVNRVNQIIDKYKAESEPQESEKE